MFQTVIFLKVNWKFQDKNEVAVKMEVKTSQKVENKYTDSFYCCQYFVCFTVRHSPNMGQWPACVWLLF